jgi:hypothetical protein
VNHKKAIVLNGISVNIMAKRYVTDAVEIINLLIMVTILIENFEIAKMQERKINAFKKSKRSSRSV